MSKLCKPFFSTIFRCIGDGFPEECEACTQVGVPVFHKNRSAEERRLVMDPRSENVQRWNRLIVLARGVALAVDPLYFFSVCVGGACIYVDGGVATAVSVLRSCVDLVHVAHLFVRLRLAYVSRESLVVGCGNLVWDARAIAAHYLLSLEAFWFDLFVIVPIPQY